MAIINSININQAQLAGNRVDNTSRPVVRQTDAGIKTNTPPSDPIPQQKHENSRLALGQRQSINASRNDAAVSIRTADKAMKTINSHIISMKKQLTIIVKNYPPFLTNDPDRVRALRSFSAFRKEIEALTIPPQNNGADKLFG